MSHIKVVIVDDHSFFRRSIIQALEVEKSIEIVAAAVSGDEAIRLCRKLPVDVVLMDLNMPYLSGFAAIERITPGQQSPAVLVLTGSDGIEPVQNAFASGALGYMRKDAITDELLVSAIFTVANGGIFVDPVTFTLLRRLILSRSANNAKDAIRAAKLSLDDIELLRQVALGYDNDQIGQTLQVTSKTISNRLSQLYLTLEISNRVQAATFALRNGLVDLKDTV